MEIFESAEWPIFYLRITHLQKKLERPTIGWEPVDYLTLSMASHCPATELEAQWIELPKPLRIRSNENLWQTPNGAIWICNDMFLADPRLRQVLRGEGPDPYTEELMRRRHKRRLLKDVYDYIRNLYWSG